MTAADAIIRSRYETQTMYEFLLRDQTRKRMMYLDEGYGKSGGECYHNLYIRVLKHYKYYTINVDFWKFFKIILFL